MEEEEGRSGGRTDVGDVAVEVADSSFDFVFVLYEQGEEPDTGPNSLPRKQNIKTSISLTSDSGGLRDGQ